MTVLMNFHLCLCLSLSSVALAISLSFDALGKQSHVHTSSNYAKESACCRFNESGSRLVIITGFAIAVALNNALLIGDPTFETCSRASNRVPCRGWLSPIVAWYLEPSKIQQLVMAINSANAVR
jgi:hypothetical protein